MDAKLIWEINIKGYKSKNSAKFFFETKRFRLSPSSEFQDTID